MQYYSCTYRESNCSCPAVAKSYRIIGLLNIKMNSLGRRLTAKRGLMTVTLLYIQESVALPYWWPPTVKNLQSDQAGH
jgi:hypothetical protein